MWEGLEDWFVQPGGQRGTGVDPSAARVQTFSFQQITIHFLRTHIYLDLNIRLGTDT